MKFLVKTESDQLLDNELFAEFVIEDEQQIIITGGQGISSGSGSAVALVECEGTTTGGCTEESCSPNGDWDDEGCC